jgi:hypothetical protein
MFAALSTVEPPIVEHGMAALLEREKTWYEARRPILEHRVRDRLGELSDRLGGAEWLDGGFSAGDLLMVHVLLRLNGSGMLEEHSPPISPAAKPDPPTSVRSTRNWRYSRACRRPAKGPLREAPGRRSWLNGGRRLRPAWMA